MLLPKGEDVLLRLYWRAIAPVPEDYTVFTHIEKDGLVVAQKDNVPCCESPLYTTQWAVGRIVEDTYSLSTDPDGPRGAFPLLVGMYLPSNGQRLPVYDALDQPIGDSIVISEVHVGG